MPLSAPHVALVLTHDRTLVNDLVHDYTLALNRERTSLLTTSYAFIISPRVFEKYYMRLSAFNRSVLEQQ